MWTRETATVCQKLLAIVAAVAVASGLAGFSDRPAAGAQSGIVSNELVCAVLFGFAGETVPVAKSADGETVLASVEWGYSAKHDLCYLVLDDTAVSTLQANPPTTTSQLTTDADKTAAAQCHNAYNPNRGFAAEPVPVVKSTDGQTVLASVKWGYSPDYDLCYLILDDTAQQTLLTHHPCVTNPGSRECRGAPTIMEVRPNLLWSPDGTRTAYVETTYTNSTSVESIYVADRLGNNSKRIATGFIYPNLVQKLTWSPDGVQLAFSHVHGHGYRGGIRVVNADGSSDVAWLSPCGNRPVWSPDATRIAFMVRATRSCSQTQGTYAVTADGSKLYKISDFFTLGIEHLRWNSDGSAPEPSPDWSMPGISPSGDLRVIVQRGFKDNEMFVSDGSLTISIGKGTSPHWSPDERHIVYLAGGKYSLDDGFLQDNGDTIFVVGSDGSDRREIVRIADLPKSSDPIYNTCCTWSFVAIDPFSSLPMQIIPGEDLIAVRTLGIESCSSSEYDCMSYRSYHYRTFLVEMPVQSRTKAFKPNSALTPLEAFTYRAVLSAFYTATGGRHWSNNANWNTNNPFHTWHGIQTEANGRLTGLSLSGNNLTGPIPEQLGNLTGLTTLYLQDNSLTGAIPEQLGNLTELVYFYTSGNNLCLPPSLRTWHSTIENKDPVPTCGTTPEERQALTTIY
ncbi:hypothetical protein [Candidatus Poriferisocius sp.]|uniref:hypothetical protein n=1 Tax=Candidatus Poriferisocius sp. TaxID=3101276 RepID=UPI003B0137A4